jgi:NADH-quinone oxidoreductase subunit A
MLRRSVASGCGLSTRWSANYSGAALGVAAVEAGTPSDRWREPPSGKPADPDRTWLGEARELGMDDLLREYLPILIFIGIAVGLASAMVIASLVIPAQRPDSEKVSAYECGFEAFDDARRQFDVRFYLVAILFIIFDLEVAFLFPWAISLGQIGVFGFWSMMVFLGVLTIGFIYEWKKGALEWE